MRVVTFEVKYSKLCQTYDSYIPLSNRRVQLSAFND